MTEPQHQALSDLMDGELDPDQADAAAGCAVPR